MADPPDRPAAGPAGSSAADHAVAGSAAADNAVAGSAAADNAVAGSAAADHAMTGSPGPGVFGRLKAVVGGGAQPGAGDAVVQPHSGVRQRLATVADAVLRVLGALLSVVAALLSGLLELLLLPLRFQGQLVGVSIVLAVVGNVALAWFARHTVGRRWAMALPWAAWTAFMFLAAGSTTAEGDYLLSASNWVALPMILLGSVAFGIYCYRQILAPRPLRPPTALPATPSPTPTPPPA